MQLREADKLDKNSDGKISQQEYIVLPARPMVSRPRACCPTTSASSSCSESSPEIDSNKDGQLDRVELTGSAVRQFIEMDANKDRFLTEDEFKKAQENETKKMRAVIQAMQPAPPARLARRPRRRNRAPPATAGAAPRTRWPCPRPAAGNAVAGARPQSSSARSVRDRDGDAALETARPEARPYSTVTLLARLRGWSTSVPLATAV